MFKRGSTILFIISVLGINILTVLQINWTFFLYGLGQLLLGLILFSTIIYSIIKTISDKRQISLFKKLQPLLFGLLLIPTVPLVSYLVDTDGGKKIIMQASAGGDLTYVQLDLREDGTFKLFNSGPFGGQYYRGQYTLQQDTLRLDNGDTNLYPTLSFIIKQDAAKQLKYFDPISADATKESIYKLYMQADSSSLSKR